MNWDSKARISGKGDTSRRKLLIGLFGQSPMRFISVAG